MKKNIPLQVLKTIEPYVNKNGKSFESIKPDNFLLKLVDKDENSDFYFNIISYKIENGLQLLIDKKPHNQLTVNNQKYWIKSEQLEGSFTNWLNILDDYESVKSVFDDPILQFFADEYFTEFEIIEEDADIKPFSTKQVLLLDAHLEDIQNGIDNFQTEDNKFEIDKIKSNIEALRNNLTKKSKKWVIKQVSKIWAQITKQGPKLMKEFLTETKKQAIKEGAKQLINKGIDLINGT